MAMLLTQTLARVATPTHDPSTKWCDHADVYADELPEEGAWCLTPSDKICCITQ